MKKWIMAIDQGTSSTRCVLFDLNGIPVASDQMEFEQIYPQSGWVEHDPNQIWDTVLLTCKNAMKKAQANAAQIIGIGITNQRETTLVWNKKTGQVVYNAIVWQDRRTAKQCDDIKQTKMADVIWKKTGLIVDPYFSASKIRWILDHNENLQNQASKGELCFGTVDCYLLFKLTKGESFKTDVTNASRTMLFNIQTKQWDDQLLTLFNIPKHMLPEVFDNGANFGVTDLFGADIPILAMAGDQHAAMIGQACFKTGQVKSTYGTGCFMMSQLERNFRLSQYHLLTTIAFQFKGDTHYALEGSIFMAGATIQWLRDNLQVINDASDTSEHANKVGADNPVILIPAFVGLGAPYWNADATASIIGMTRDTTQSHIITAALQSSVYQTYDLLFAMEQDSQKKINEIKVDGAMVNNQWLMQFLADITTSEIKQPINIETTAQGIAYAVMLQAGLFASLTDIENAWQCQNSYHPKMELSLRDALILRWKQALQKVL
ncbi:glycerol kinase GlpK [Marinicellulosiphila megalodicopiae]|uniref:glycerol kinase GlpK n=1 Tax=Marinicellulosiphila megalodicopiae TaxID=2724896 RepID=UPI003BAE41ED